MKKPWLFLILFFIFSCDSEETVPIYDYYKNIPVIRGWTADEKPTSFLIEVVLVYRENNEDLKTMINQLKNPFIDNLRRYFTSLKEEEFVLENQPKMKREAVAMLNELLLDSMIPKEADKLRESKSLEELDLILDMNIMQIQIFDLD